MVMVSATKAKLSNEVALAELERIRQENGGILKAEAVVESASDITSPLHDQFQWDDTKAAEEWRLQQARQLIRTVIVILPNYSKPTSAYVSLMDDRTQDNGGYRTIVDVMSDTSLREKLLTEALADLQRWEVKYAQLQELVPIFQTIAKLRKKNK